MDINPPVRLEYARPDNTRGTRSITLLALLCALAVPMIWVLLRVLYNAGKLEYRIAVSLVAFATLTSTWGIILGVIGARRARKNYAAAFAAVLNFLWTILNCAGLSTAD